MTRSRRVLRRARRSGRAVASRLREVGESSRLPVGRAAAKRALLRSALGDDVHALVIGPADIVLQALPHAIVDVVGTNPLQRSLTVISEANGADSLPRRWNTVIVTDPKPSADRLAAASAACLPGGTVVVLRARASGNDALVVPRAVVERIFSKRSVRLVLTRVSV